MLRDVPRARGADRGRDRVRRAARGSLRHVVARANTVDALKDAGTPARARSATAGRGFTRRARGKLPAHTHSSERRRGSRGRRGLVLGELELAEDRVPGTHHEIVLLTTAKIFAHVGAKIPRSAE